MRKLIASLVLATIVISPAYAWGDREQGILAGVAGLYLLQKLNQGAAQPAPVYVDPRFPGTVNPGGYVPPSTYTYRPMYRAVDVFIPECNCYRTIMVQVN